MKPCNQNIGCGQKFRNFDLKNNWATFIDWIKVYDTKQRESLQIKIRKTKNLIYKLPTSGWT